MACTCKAKSSLKQFFCMLLFAVGVFSASFSYASECPNQTIEDRFAKSEMVFSGKVVEIEPVAYENYVPNPPALNNYIGVKPHKIWKYDWRLHGEIFGLGERYISKK